MDKHTAEDINNPINQQPTINFCQVCDIEESKTYFVDETQICENCFDEEIKE